MPFYPSAGALLADVRLRLDGLGRDSVALVVEGPDDKRLFLHWASNFATIVPAGGRGLLLGAYGEMLPADQGRVLFLTDCDYEVRTGRLRGGPGIIITSNCDVESDLVSLGILERVVIELVPSVLGDKSKAALLADKLYKASLELALPFGRARMAALSLGISLALEDENIRFGKYRDPRSKAILDEKVWRDMWTRMDGCPLSCGEWMKLVSSTPQDYGMCHGKDLVRIVHMLLREDHGVKDVDAHNLARMVRLSVDFDHLNRWPVIHRIRRWEALNSKTLLRSP